MSSAVTLLRGFNIFIINCDILVMVFSMSAAHFWGNFPFSLHLFVLCYYICFALVYCFFWIISLLWTRWFFIGKKSGSSYWLLEFSWCFRFILVWMRSPQPVKIRIKGLLIIPSISPPLSAVIPFYPDLSTAYPFLYPCLSSFQTYKLPQPVSAGNSHVQR